MKFLQKLGKALMLPVAVLPICGILMGIGYRLCPATMQGGEIQGAANLIGLFLVYHLGKKRRFDGQCFLFYVFWYGLGRTWIEGLRTDSLYLFHWTLFGQRIRVSQALSLVMVLVCAGILVYQFKVKKADGSNLFVKRVQQSAEAEETAASDEQQ